MTFFVEKLTEDVFFYSNCLILCRKIDFFLAYVQKKQYLCSRKRAEKLFKFLRAFFNIKRTCHYNVV